MRQLIFGFFGEGPTDERYFPTLLTEYLDQAYALRGIEVEIASPIIMLSTQRAFLDQMREIEQEYSGLPLFFIHMDADSRDARSVLARKWHPWLEECQEPRRWIPIIPVKMLESWLLADSQVLSQTFVLPVSQIQRITGGANPENISDPKSTLEEIKRAGKQRRPSGREETIAQRTRLSELEKLPSFQAFARDVEERLDDLF